MNSLTMVPINHPINAEVKIPGSKSLTNRALLIGALAPGKTHLLNALFSDDSLYFANALQALGFGINVDQEKRELSITGFGGKIPANSAELFIGNAGTAARFLSAFLTLGDGEYILDGDTRMRERPIGDLVSSLSELGANIAPANSQERQGKIDICPPVKITASGLPGGQTKVAGNISSQFLSALLMVAPYAKESVEITVSTELNSKPYVDMTLEVMADFGIRVSRDEYRWFKINSGRYHSIQDYVIEPDASAASYFFAAPALLGGSVKVMNLNKKSKQGDIGFLLLLQKMGCVVSEYENSLVVTGPPSILDLQGIDVDMSDIPDTAQTLAAIAPFAATPTTIRGIASARVKESDRVSATCVELTRLGVHVEEHPDGMTIFPTRNFLPATIKTYKDHRMAMSFGLIGLKVPGVQIADPGCVSKTFPEYFSVLESLR